MDGNVKTYLCFPKPRHYSCNCSMRIMARFRHCTWVPLHWDVVEDSVSKEMIWREGNTMYYSKGVTDPDYGVLRFTAESGRYYANLHYECSYI